MGNTLTSLIPDIYAALDVVSRELTGFIPAVQRDANADRVAAGQNLDITVTPKNTAGGTVTPAMSFPSAADQTLAPVQLTITKQRFYPFSWSGEEQKGVDFGPGFLTLKQDQIAQAIRGLVNEIEADIADSYKLASRGYGTAAQTPFASDLSDPANVRKILDDNGAPAGDRTLVINTTAGAKLRTLAQVTKANESGTDTVLRQGTLIDLHGFAIRESAQIKTPAVGGGTGYVINGAHAAGATSVVVKTGAGTILAGDVITIANGTPADGTTKYVVTTGIAAPGTLTIAAPGLLAAHADSDAVAIIGAHANNLAFSRNAILLATRLPAVPAEGDLASDRMTVTDPRTGLSFEFAIYPGYRMNVYQVLAAWGVKVIKPEHLAILLG